MPVVMAERSSQPERWMDLPCGIRAPYRALTTLMKPPGKLLQGVNPEYP